MKRKTATLIISYFCAALAVLGVFAHSQYKRAEDYSRYLASNYQHAFDELVSGMSQIDSALQKSLYAASPGITGAILTEIFGKAMMVQQALGILPCNTIELEQTAGFISRVGDYSYALSRSASSGTGYSGEERENLKKLSETASLLSQNLNSMQMDMNEGTLTMDDLRAGLDSQGAYGGEIPNTVGGSMRLIEGEFPEIPALIYDGPFSQHLTGREPMMLRGSKEFSEDEARKKASDFISLGEGRLYSSGKSAGELPCYYFTASIEGGELTIAVSVMGGQVIELLSSRVPADASLSKEEGIKIAKSFLERRGYTDMVESYYIIRDNIMNINFAYRQGDVICYSDLVKVGIALDNGAVCRFESKGYLMAHHERELPAVTVSEEDARVNLSSDLELLEHELVLIPNSGEREVLCHEFKCKTPDDRHYIVYVDALTGQQEKILILLEDDSGTLTI